MSYEEFLGVAKGVQKLDPGLWRQLRSLMVEGGTLAQLVRALLDTRDGIQEQLANKQMIRDEDIRIAIGMQGQVLGLNNALQVIYQALQEPPKEDEDERVSG